MRGRKRGQGKEKRREKREGREEAGREGRKDRERRGGREEKKGREGREKDRRREKRGEETRKERKVSKLIKISENIKNLLYASVRHSTRGIPHHPRRDKHHNKDQLLKASMASNLKGRTVF